MDYRQKYHKYKSKYMMLKNQYGGENLLNIIDNYKFPIPIKTYPLDINFVEKKMHLIKNNLDSDEIKIIDDIIKATTHIPFYKFIEELKKSINIFKSTIGNKEYILYITNPTKHVDNDIRQKSNFWVSSMVYHLLGDCRPTKIVDIIDYTTLKNNADDANNILICDDCSYSGNQLGTIINNLVYGTIESKHINMHVHLIIPFITNDALNYFTKSLPKLKISVYNTYIVKRIEEMFTSDFCTKAKNLGLYIANPCPIYFDHRVADYLSSFDQFYLFGRINKNYEPYFTTYIGSPIIGCEELTKFMEGVDPYSNVIELPWNKCPPIPYKDQKNVNIINISHVDFIKIYGFDSNYNPYLNLSYSKNKEGYIKFNKKISVDKIDELCSILLKFSKCITKYLNFNYVFLYNNDVAKIYINAYIDGTNNKQFNIQYLKNNFKENGERLYLLEDEKNEYIIGIRTTFSIPFVDTKDVEELLCIIDNNFE